MAYERAIGGGLRVVSTGPVHFAQLDALQRVVFPTLAEDELFRAEHYARHVELFPEGQLVVVDGDRVVGMTSSVRYDFDLGHADHTFAEMIQGGWLTSHQPQGAWLYGADIGVHPDYRGRGLARALYAARHEAVRRLGLRGQVTVGLINGYGAVADRLSPEAYFQQLLAGERTDPTVSAQQKVGFALRRLVRGYVRDPRCGDCGVLMILPSETPVAWPDERRPGRPPANSL